MYFFSVFNDYVFFFSFIILNRTRFFCVVMCCHDFYGMWLKFYLYFFELYILEKLVQIKGNNGLRTFTLQTKNIMNKKKKQ